MIRQKCLYKNVLNFGKFGNILSAYQQGFFKQFSKYGLQTLRGTQNPYTGALMRKTIFIM